MYLSIVVFVAFVLFYFFNNTFQQVINNLLAAAGNWLIRRFHMPNWITPALRWLWQRFRGLLVFALATSVLLSFLWAYAYRTDNTQVLLVAMVVTGSLMFVIAVLSQIWQGFADFFGVQMKTGGFSKTAITIIFLIMVNGALLSVPNNWYFANLWVPVVITSLLLFFMLVGWYDNKPNKLTTVTFTVLFIGSLLFSGYMNWEAKKVNFFPRWLEEKLENFSTNFDQSRIRDYGEKKIILAKVITPTIAYIYENETVKPNPEIKYHRNQIFYLVDKNTDPIYYEGESYVQVYYKNKRTHNKKRVLVPMLNVELLRPSEQRKETEAKARAKADLLARTDSVTAVNEVWAPQSLGDYFDIVLPPKAAVGFKSIVVGERVEKVNFANPTRYIRKITWHPSHTHYVVTKMKNAKTIKIIKKRRDV